MTNVRQVSFCGNDETDMHCFPASICMMLNALLPQSHYSLQDCIGMTGAIEGKSVWPARALIAMRQLELDVVMIEGFDGRDFIKRGTDYLRDTFGEEASRWMIKNSDIPREQADYQRLYDAGVQVEKRIPTLDDIRHFLAKGYMVKATVNSKKLAGATGYVGHAVVILSVNDNEVILHNPGLPPVPNQHVRINVFESAWADPNENAKEIIAVGRLN